MFDCQQPIPVGGSRQDEEIVRLCFPQEGIEIHSRTLHRVESTCSLQDLNAKFASCHLQSAATYACGRLANGFKLHCGWLLENGCINLHLLAGGSA